MEFNKFGQINWLFSLVEKYGFNLSFWEEFTYNDLVIWSGRELDRKVWVSVSHKLDIRYFEENYRVVALIISIFIDREFALVLTKFKVIVFIASTLNLLWKVTIIQLIILTLVILNAGLL